MAAVAAAVVRPIVFEADDEAVEKSEEKVDSLVAAVAALAEAAAAVRPIVCEAVDPVVAAVDLQLEGRQRADDVAISPATTAL